MHVFDVLHTVELDGERQRADGTLVWTDAQMNAHMTFQIMSFVEFSRTNGAAEFPTSTSSTGQVIDEASLESIKRTSHR